MRPLHILAAAYHLANLAGENPSFTFAFETRTILHPHCRFRQSSIGSNSRPSFRSTKSTRIYSKPEEYDDGIGDITNRKTDSDGEDLVAEFYKSLQNREDIDVGVNKIEEDETFDVTGGSKSTSMPPSSLGRTETSSLFGNNEYYDAEETQSTTPKVKFTGSNYFGGSSNNNDNAKNTVRETMMRREYDLVSRATGPTALSFQAGLALIMLIFFLYVGLTGGIVSGEAQDFGGDDFIQFEQIIPVPRDSDNSVWI